MSRRESIQQIRREIRESQIAFESRLAALEEVKRANIRKVARLLPTVPSAVERYLASPNPFLSDERPDGGEDDARP